VSDVEQEARIALLEYYSSLMNGYKMYILSFIIGILTVVEVWFRIPELNRTFYVNSFMSLCLGGMFAGIITCVLRFFLCGKIVEAAVNEGKTVLYQVDRAIKVYAGCEPEERGNKKQGRIPKTVNGLSKRLIQIANCQPQLFLIWVALTLVFCYMIFLSASLFGLSFNV